MSPRRTSRIGGALAVACLWMLPSRAQNPDLPGIAHVAFRVRNYEKSRNFYQTLGFEQAFEFSDPGKPRVSYLKINDRQFIELYQNTEGSEPGFMHICLETGDIEALHKAYVNAGLRPTETKKFRAGNLLFTMHDPEGQLLEYTQYLPGSLHSNDNGKHLGKHRISEHLLRSSTSAKDRSSQRDFYASKLGFRSVAGSSDQLGLPGKSQDGIELLSATDAKPRIVFAVHSLSRTTKYLRTHGLAVKRLEKMLYVTDPDGVVVLFAVPGS